MKKAILSSILLLSSTTIFADTTMCFKEGASMSTIENTPLNGGACDGKYSVNDMKTKGWNVDDIKISQSPNGMNFIYILKTKTSQIQAVAPVVATGNQAEMEARILAKLEAKKEEEKKQKEAEIQKDFATEGENTYVKKCQSCHGANGELEARGYSRPLKDLSLEDMQVAIRDYTQGTYNRGLAVLMTPIANGVSSRDIEKVYAYLNKINKK